MAESTIPQQLMTGALMHFEQGVPIDDLDLRREHRERMARVQHVYWQWVRNPITLDPFAMFKQLVKGKGADVYSEWRMAQKDKFLFDFVVEHVAPPSRRIDEAKVRAAADKMMQIGMATDNVNALDKGSKRLMEVAQLDKPESQQADISKAMFIPPVVTTVASEIDPTKEDQTDEQARLIMDKYNAYVDDKRKSVDDKVEVMMAKRQAKESEGTPKPSERPIVIPSFTEEVKEHKPMTVNYVEKEPNE